MAREYARRAGREWDHSWKFERTNRFRKCNLTSITAKVCITSLNSHYRLQELSTEFGSLVSKGKVWIKVWYMQFASGLMEFYVRPNSK
jgi:hypothetical protein